MNKMKFGITHQGMHVDQLLSNFATNYRPEGLIADAIMPVIPVSKQADTFAIFPRSDALRIEETARAAGTEANIITRSASSGTFYCQNYALASMATVEDKANADPIFTSEIINGQVMWIMDKLFLDWENRVATQVTNTSNVGSSAAVNSSWSDLTNSTPLIDIYEALDNVRDAQGKRPNKIVFSEKAWRNFSRNVGVRNLINGTNNGGGNATREQARALFEVDQLLVGECFKNTGNEAQAEVLTSIWGDHVLVSYTSLVATRDRPTYAASFRWQAAGIPNMQVERHPFDSHKKAEKIEVGYYQDEKITGQGFSFLITNTTSST